MDGFQSEFSESAPPLTVFAPTSQLAAARTGSAPFRNRRNLSRYDSNTNTKRSPNQYHVIDTSSNRTSAAQRESRSTFRRVLGVFPSWLVSMVLHLALLMLLTIFTYGTDEPEAQVVLELAESTALFEIATTEIEIKDFVLEEVQELEPTQLESPEIEMPTIPREMLEVFSQMELDSNLDELVDFGDIKKGVGDQAGQGVGNGAPQSSNSGPAAKFFGIKSKGARIVFVIDCSKSMHGNRWYRAVKELNSAIDRMTNDQQFLVLLYNTRMSVMMDIPVSEANLIRSSEENKRAFRKWLRKQRTQGGTFPARAMFAALRLKPDSIFLLSDGELQDSTTRLLDLWNLPVENSAGVKSKIPINTISLGKSGTGQEKMQTIAKQNEGEFTWIK